jgi:hypothetical protein
VQVVAAEDAAGGAEHEQEEISIGALDEPGGGEPEPGGGGAELQRRCGELVSCSGVRGRPSRLVPAACLASVTHRTTCRLMSPRE